MFQKSSISWDIFFYDQDRVHLTYILKMSDNIMQPSNKRSRVDDEVIDLVEDEQICEILKKNRIETCDKMSTEEYDLAFDRAREMYAIDYILNWTEEDYEEMTQAERYEDEDKNDPDNHDVIYRSFFRKGQNGYIARDPKKHLKDDVRIQMMCFERDVEHGEAPEEAATNYQFSFALLAKYLKEDRHFTSTKEGIKKRILMECGYDSEEENENEEDDA